MAYYNLGFMEQMKHNLPGAMKYYALSLEANPSDEGTRLALEYLASLGTR